MKNNNLQKLCDATGHQFIAMKTSVTWSVDGNSSESTRYECVVCGDCEWKWVDKIKGDVISERATQSGKDFRDELRKVSHSE